jgi:DnaJ-class molecular chaperone
MRVQTLDAEPVQIQLKPGTSGGTTVRLRGKGMPRQDASGSTTHGDLYLTVQIQVPTALTPEQRAAFEALRGMMG